MTLQKKTNIIEFKNYWKFVKIKCKSFIWDPCIRAYFMIWQCSDTRNEQVFLLFC